MSQPTMRQLAERLSTIAEAVCSHYLSNGRKEGHYWKVGDVHNTAGGSLFVRLTGPTYGPGAAGKWTDAATGEHGDLLDIIALNRGLTEPQAIRAEAMEFLSEPVRYQRLRSNPAPSNSSPSAQRLFAASKPLHGTLAESYLRSRGITCSLELSALRFHPHCYLKLGSGRLELPAFIAAVTDLSRNITAVQRTFLRPDGSDKADLHEPRRAMGDILGNAVRLGVADDVLAAGEGIETMLALRSLLPGMPMNAALTANHLAALKLPKGLKRLYIAMDNDKAGEGAAEQLAITAFGQGVDVQLLRPTFKDWNLDLQRLPRAELVLNLNALLQPEDRQRFLRAPLLQSA